MPLAIHSHNTNKCVVKKKKKRSYRRCGIMFVWEERPISSNSTKVSPAPVFRVLPASVKPSGKQRTELCALQEMKQVKPWLLPPLITGAPLEGLHVLDTQYSFSFSRQPCKTGTIIPTLKMRRLRFSGGGNISKPYNPSDMIPIELPPANLQSLCFPFYALCAPSNYSTD